MVRLLTFLIFGAWLNAAQAEGLRVFAAASLQGVLDEIASDWANDTKTDLRITYGASSAMARQIDQGAPVDVFLSAHPQWVDWLRARVDHAGAPVVFAHNRLVVIAPSPADLMSLSGETWRSAIATTRLAIPIVAAVPAGVYAKQSLTYLGLWDSVKHKLAQSVNVRATLSLVARGETQLGIVYASDAILDPDVTVVAPLPEDSHDRIDYVAVSLTTRADMFLDFLILDRAQNRFKHNGFVPLEKGGQ